MRTGSEQTRVLLGVVQPAAHARTQRRRVRLAQLALVGLFLLVVVTACGTLGLANQRHGARSRRQMVLVSPETIAPHLVSLS
jgi:hypothetical protein